jgi:uncharacterized protein YjbI with pentapeptide repeats
MKIINPLQITPQSVVLEQDNKFRLILSSTLAIDLNDNESILAIDSIKKTIESMADKPVFDMGMPKPKAEFLVSGSYYSPRNKPVSAGEAKISVGGKEKSLYVFGPRHWSGGLPTRPEPITTLPLNYNFAFGGANFPDNPDGIGFKDGLLPQIESPTSLIDSSNAQTQAAGFAPLEPFCPKRARYMGTYDERYMKNYFPGYPADMDWRAFMCSHEDQWRDDYYAGDESFELHNMHPEQPLIKGKLPSLYSRAFVQYKKGTDAGNDNAIKEISMNIDTLWFFPEAKIALLISRGGIEVNDDEASEISHTMLAYERRSDPQRDLAYYQTALNRRLQSDDRLLDNLNTQDLIALGDKCAMELLQDMAQVDDTSNAFADNMDTKVARVHEMVDTEMDKAKGTLEKQLADSKIPEDQKPDLDALLKPGKQTNPEVEDLKRKMDEILPGINSGNPKDIKLKDFSFDKIDKLMALTTEFTDKKQDEAKALMKPELEKAKASLLEQLEQLEQLEKNAEALTTENNKLIQANIKQLDDMIEDKTPDAPLPRMNAEEIIGEMNAMSPEISNQILTLQKMEAMGSDAETLKKVGLQLQDLIKTENNTMHQQIRDTEKSFKEAYIMGAHAMKDGLPPHKADVAEVKSDFMRKRAGGEILADRDWACIDLRGQQLDNIDLSGAYLEQVDFTGASLRNANFSGAILARAILDNCDLSGANLEGANVGGVHAHNANFTGADLTGAQLSNGDFTKANFSECQMEGMQPLEICVDEASFDGAKMNGMLFLERHLRGSQFSGSTMDKSIFIDSQFDDVSFERTHMHKCTFTDARIQKVNFDGADMTGSCFVSTEEGKSAMTEVSFVEADLSKCNLQGMQMAKAKMHKARLEYASLMDADLSGADLSSVQAKGATFRKTKLERSNLKNINAMEASMGKANLMGASFVGANLFAVDFLRSTIGDTDFTGANLDITLIEDWRPS